MSDSVKAVWSKHEPEEVEQEEKKPDAAAERIVVARTFPNLHGLDRTIAFLFDYKGAKFFRVNFHDPDNQNYITKSHFVEVRGDKAEAWPEPVYLPRSKERDW